MNAIDFNQLLLHNADHLRPFAITLTKDTEKAKDLYQETLLRAYSNMEKYNLGTNIKAWLYTIMRNIFINDYRKNAKHRELLAAGGRSVLAAQTVDQNMGVELIQTKIIKKAMNELPEIFKNPFLLYIDGFRYNEIADLLGEPLGTIKSRIHFARKLLKSQLERY